MRSAVLALAVVFTSSAWPGLAADLACEREMMRAAKRYDIPLGVLYAVGLTETGQAAAPCSPSP